MTRLESSAEVPLRGEVWDAHLPPPIGVHPVVVVMSNALIPRMSSVTVVVVTGTPGPSTTHVRLDSDAGLTKYPVSWANAASVHAIPKTRFRRLRGRLSSVEIENLGAALKSVLAL